MHYVVDDIVKYHPDYLSGDEADSAFLDLLNYQVSAKKETGVMFGKSWTSERRTIQISEPGVRVYKYSGASASSTLAFEEVEVVKKIRDGLRKKYGTFFNFCLVNYYPVVFTQDGEVDTKKTPVLRWHSDDEDDMVAGKPIASISLGDSRRFRVREKGSNVVRWDHPLEHGSLVIMEGDCQERTEHCIWSLAKNDKMMFGIRINLTFRVMRVKTS